MAMASFPSFHPIFPSSEFISVLVGHPINRTIFDGDHLQQNELSRVSLKQSVIDVVHR